MTDYFALLSQPRRPRLNEGDLKSVYLRLSAEVHPDVGGNPERFRDVQEGYQILLRPALRLRHLLDLEFGEGIALPASRHQEVFLQVGAAVQAARRAWQEHNAARSALARAVGVSGVRAAVGLLENAEDAVGVVLEEAGRDLDAVDADWPLGESGRLVNLTSDWIYLSRWQGELSEWRFRLTME